MLLHYGTNGGVLGFYTPEIHNEIPSPVIEITKAQWGQILSNPACFKVVDGKVTEIPEPPIPDEVKLAGIRSQRNKLLADCDFTQLPDCPLTAQKKAEFAVYRQLLRDLPANCDLNNPIFPIKPEA